MRHLRRPLLQRLRSERGSLPLALLLIILTAAMAAAVTLTVVVSMDKTRESRAMTTAQQSADAALHNAVMYGNLGGFKGQSRASLLAAEPTEGAHGDTTWRWSVTGVAGDEVTISIEVQNTHTSRAYTARLGRTQVQNGLETPDEANGAEDNGRARYLIAQGSGFTAGFFGSTDVSLSANTRVNGRVSTNGNVSLAPGATVSEVLLYNGASLPYPERCTGAPCSNTRIQMEAVNFGVSNTSTSTAATQFITGTCQGNLRPWAASSGQPLADDTCYSSLTFDANTVLPAGSDYDIYVSGDVTVTDGVSVNWPGTEAAPENLSIYTVADRVTVGRNAKVAWLLWAPQATCSGNGGTATTEMTRVTGSMICNRLSTTGRWELGHDMDAALTQTPPLYTEVWSIRDYRQA